MQANNPIKPSHYKNGEHDLLWHLKDLFTIEEFRGAMKMNIIKYTMRYENKNGIEDLEKANQYIKVLKEFEQEMLDRGDSVGEYKYGFTKEELEELKELYSKYSQLEKAKLGILQSADKYHNLKSHLSQDEYITAIEEWWSFEDKETKGDKQND